MKVTSEVVALSKKRSKKGLMKCARCKVEVPKIKGKRICEICRTRCSRCGILLMPYNIAPRTKNSAFTCKKCINSNGGNWKDNNYKELKESRRNSKLKSQYGITLTEYNLLLNSKNGRCWICGSLPKNRNLSVDHKHLLNEKKLRKEKGHVLFRKNVRGILCWKCNGAIGKFEDDPKRLRAAAEYLETSTAQHILNDQ